MTTQFTEDHEWIRREGEVAVVGITAHAAEQLGDIVFVEIISGGTTVEKGGNLGTIESVKAASEIFAPATGEILEVNGELEGNPAIVNESPGDQGWLCKIKLKTPSELDKLMDEAAYQRFIED